MFIIAIVFLAGMLSVVQTSLFAYSVMDISQSMKGNDIFMFENVKDVINDTITSTSDCLELRERLDELKVFLEEPKKFFEYGIKFHALLDCNNWTNSPPAGPPIRGTVEISSISIKPVMVTKYSFIAYRTGIYEKQ